VSIIPCDFCIKGQSAKGDGSCNDETDCSYLELLKLVNKCSCGNGFDPDCLSDHHHNVINSVPSYEKQEDDPHMHPDNVPW